jgi:hypothetical protein
MVRQGFPKDADVSNMLTLAAQLAGRYRAGVEAFTTAREATIKAKEDEARALAAEHEAA